MCRQPRLVNLSDHLDDWEETLVTPWNDALNTSLPHVLGFLPPSPMACVSHEMISKFVCLSVLAELNRFYMFAFSCVLAVGDVGTRLA